MRKIALVVIMIGAGPLAQANAEQVAGETVISAIPPWVQPATHAGNGPRGPIKVNKDREPESNKGDREDVHFEPAPDERRDMSALDGFREYIRNHVRGVSHSESGGSFVPATALP